MKVYPLLSNGVVLVEHCVRVVIVVIVGAIGMEIFHLMILYLMVLLLMLKCKHMVQVVIVVN